MLQIKNLHKSYGKFQAVRGLDLEIEKGEIFGFVGPNGAGKTSTMKIVAGLLSADFGEVYVDGIDAINHIGKVKEKIGYMPDFFGVYDNLKAIEYMEFYASIYGILGKEARQISLDLLDLVNLSDKADTYVDSLSRGMKQRLCLARSLVHNPELLILDEPASGMDPRARFEMKEILKNLREMGKTIIVSSHILPELAEMCTSLGIIERGRMMVSGTVEDILFKSEFSRPITIKVLKEQEKAALLLKELPSIRKVQVLEESLSCECTGGEEERVAILAYLVQQGIPVISFTQEAGNLEDIFMKITAKDEE